MAKKGNVVWEVFKVLKNGNRQHYALREDGAILQKYVLLDSQDGSVKHDYGWKVYKTAKQARSKDVNIDAFRSRLLSEKYEVRR